jgi:arabinose-5-phosphate isomerase
MANALVAMTEKSFGCVGVTDTRGRLIGVITDGDLRRHMGPSLLEATVDDIMTAKPKTIAPSLLASAALELINASSITALFVVEKQKPVGLIHVHDLLRLGVA